MNRNDLIEDNEEALASTILLATRLMLLATAELVLLALLAYMLWVR